MALCSWYLQSAPINARNAYLFGALQAGQQMPEEFAVGVDVGQSLDPTAVCVMSRIPLGPHLTAKFFEPADPEHDETKPPEGPSTDDLETAFRERHRKNRTRPTA